MTTPQADFNPVDLYKQIGALARAVCEAMENITAQMQETFDSLAAAIVPMIYKAYCEAGKPYGDTTDGMWKWAREEATKKEGPCLPTDH